MPFKSSLKFASYRIVSSWHRMAKEQRMRWSPLRPRRVAVIRAMVFDH
jgi:hypothetical protein